MSSTVVLWIQFHALSYIACKKKVQYINEVKNIANADEDDNETKIIIIIITPAYVEFKLPATAADNNNYSFTDAGS